MASVRARRPYRIRARWPNDGGEVGALFAGAGELFGAINRADRRQREEDRRRHREAGDIAMLQAKDAYIDWSTDFSGQEGYEDMSSADLLKAHRDKIRELVTGMDDYEEQSARLDGTLSNLASGPVTAARKREQNERRANLAITLADAEERTVASMSDYARAFADGDTQAQSVAFKAYQDDKADRATARQAALGEGGWTVDERRRLAVEDESIEKAIMLNAFGQRALRDNTVRSLVAAIENRKDNFGPGGERLTKGMRPGQVREWVSGLLRESATRNRSREAELDRIRAERRAAKEEQLRNDKSVVTRSPNPAGDAIEIARMRATTDPDNALALMEFEKKWSTAITDGTDAAVHDSPNAKVNFARLRGDLALVSDDVELAQWKERVLAASPGGSHGISEQMASDLDSLATAREELLDGMDQEEKDSFREWNRTIRGRRSALIGFDPEGLFNLSFDKDPTDIIDGAGVVEDIYTDYYEAFRQGGRTPAEMRLYADLATYDAQLLLTADEDDARFDNVDREEILAKSSRLLQVIAGQGELPDTPMGYMAMRLPDQVFNALPPATENGDLPSADVVMDRLREVLGREDAAKAYLRMITPLAGQYRDLKASAPPLAIMDWQRKFREGYDALANLDATQGTP